MDDSEQVDIVDQQGDVLETTSKEDAHRRGLLHKTVITEVIDSQGRWLLVRQSKNRQDAGQFVSPVGGHVRAGESEDEALRREAGEEVGLTGDFRYELVGRAVFDRHVLGRQENHFFILFKIYSDEKPILNHESESCRYFTEDDLRNEFTHHPEHFGEAFHFVVRTFFPEFTRVL